MPFVASEIYKEMFMKKGFVIAIDFDGTLCTDIYPNIGIETPILGYIKLLKSYGCKIILWTCRRDDILENAIEWCKIRGLTFDAINSNLKENIEQYGGDTRKVCADVYIDDKSILNSSNPTMDMIIYLKNLLNKIKEDF